MKIITENNFQEAILKLSKLSKTCKVAIAYCGQDGYQFFPENHRPESIKFLIDTSTNTVKQGMTNPNGVERLLQIGEVRSLERLHAKIIIFDKAALIGSINLSENSLNQYQCCIEVNNANIVQGLNVWFNKYWKIAENINENKIRKLIKIWPNKKGSIPENKKEGKQKFTKWKNPLQKALTPEDFSITDKSILKRFLNESKNNICEYHPDDKLSCYKQCKISSRYYLSESRKLKKLIQKIDKWKKDDIAELFDFAFINSGAAKIRKPSFLKQGVFKIRTSIKYLYGTGDPYVRFENIAPKSSDYHIEGFGPAAIAMLMHLWNPKEYAVYNGAAEEGLKKLTVTFKGRFSNRMGQGYKDRTASIKFLAKETGLNSLSAVDHFIDAVGKEHIKI